MSDLFFHPRKFFSGQLGLGRTPYLVLVTWGYGMAAAIDRIDRELLRAELGRPRPYWEELGPWVTGSWLGFWTWVIAFGAVSGFFLWWVGGWWYRVRLRWSGAQEPHKRLARLLYIYSSFVYAGPQVAAALARTLLYSNYVEAYSAEEFYSLILLVFPFWSLITSYIGARTMFELSPWKARIWFVILPGLLYLFLLGLLVILVALLGS